MNKARTMCCFLLLLCPDAAGDDPEGVARLDWAAGSGERSVLFGRLAGRARYRLGCLGGNGDADPRQAGGGLVQRLNGHGYQVPFGEFVSGVKAFSSQPMKP